MIYIGIDGGGTKTRLRATDEADRVLCEATGGGSSLTSLSPERVERHLRELLDEVFGRGIPQERCAALCLGSAGAMEAGVRAQLKEMLRRICPRISRIEVVSDSVGALFGAYENGQGVLLVSGTGSVGIALGARGILSRVGGWGHLIDDDGSGYEIGRQVLRAVLGAQDGRRPATALTRLVLERLSLGSAPEIVGYVYADLLDKSRIAALAPLCEAAAAGGDAVAAGIVRDAASALFLLYRAACAGAELTPEERRVCVLTGSVGEKFQALREAFSDMLRGAGAELVLPISGAANGCCRIARRAGSVSF